MSVEVYESHPFYILDKFKHFINDHLENLRYFAEYEYTKRGSQAVLSVYWARNIEGKYLQLFFI